MLIFFLLFSFFNPAPPQAEAEINLWYGEEQYFLRGSSQRWINILGQVTPREKVKQLQYSLNKGNWKKLTLGCDLHRLANAGDFNIDLDTILLKNGKNSLEIKLTDTENRIKTQRVHIHYSQKSDWQLPFTIDWQKEATIQKALQVIDGQWKITPEGIRTVNSYYDRTLGFGNQSWQNYEVQTTVIFHGFTPPQDGPPTYNVSHAAIAVYWPGHDADTLQPHRKWFPLGATAEFMLSKDLQNCHWRIFDGEKLYSEDKTGKWAVVIGEEYGFKHRVITQKDGRIHYRVKIWKQAQPEPSEWAFESFENEPSVHNKGGALLLAHHTDVTFGNIRVTPVSD